MQSCKGSAVNKRKQAKGKKKMIKKQNKNYTAEEKNVQRLKLWLEL